MPDGLSNLKRRIGRILRQNGLSMAHRIEDIAEAFRGQAGYCDSLGSPLWADQMRRAAEDIESGGPIGQIVAGWSGDLKLGALALRFFGGLHYLALAGLAPALARQLPSTGGTPDGLLWAALLAAVGDNAQLLAHAIQSPPQTNEAARSAVLLGGFLRIAARIPFALSLREVGASAGLNLCWDRFAYALGPHRWGREDSPLSLAAEWRGSAPDLSAPVAVIDRRGCDQRPIDLADPDARLWLQAYVWPDQAGRLAALRGAMEIALAAGIRVERASAAAWVARELAEPPIGRTTVIYHSVVMQYFSETERVAFLRALEQAAAAATARAPLAWLRLEHDAQLDEFTLRLTLWPGGEETLLALAHPHGRAVDWRG